MRFYRPVPGPIGDRFGAPRESGRRHSGLDFPVAYGTLVEAAGVGTTVFAGYNTGGYGNLVVVQHRLGYTTWYAHLSRITSWAGERVEGGTRHRLRRLDRALDRTAPALGGAAQQRADRPGPVPARRHCRASAVERRPTVRARCADPAAYAHRPHRRLPLGLLPARHRAQVERLVERLLVDALLQRHLADRALARRPPR